jgi:hypothetical protein
MGHWSTSFAWGTEKIFTIASPPLGRRSVRVQCSLPSLYINLNVHLTWHSDVWSNYFQDAGRSVIMSSRWLSLSLVVLPTEVNIDIVGHLAATSVTTPSEIIPYYRLNHSFWSSSDNKESSRWVLPGLHPVNHLETQRGSNVCIKLPRRRVQSALQINIKSP